MSHNRVPGTRNRRVGAALAAMTLALAGTPALAHADSDTGSLSVEQVGQTSGDGSVDQLIDLVPDKINVGGPALGSEALDGPGSSQIAGAALSVGQTLGSVAPLEALGSAGGSAVASVASSGLVPGSAYVNAVGSLGSGTFELGSLVIPEYVIPIVAVQVAGLITAEMGARQEQGLLTQDELNFWHGVVEGSAQAGTMVEDTGVPLPGSLTGSIDAVQIAAESDPHADNEQRRLEAEAAEETAGAEG